MLNIQRIEKHALHICYAPSPKKKRPRNLSNVKDISLHIKYELWNLMRLIGIFGSQLFFNEFFPLCASGN